jgi:hypothetical protein
MEHKMETLLLLLLFPVAWPFISKYWLHHTVNWTEVVLQVMVVSLLVTAVWQAGIYGQLADTEIWNGYVVSKDRVHGHYVESYSCNCRTDSKGNTTCQTCYEDHYTVTWKADTTVGSVTFEHLDRTSRRVYREPDPVSYLRCKVGEPAAIEHGYTNYVQAVPASLFNTGETQYEEYADKIPQYPRVYGFYRINRVLNVDASGIPDTEKQALNAHLNEALKTLGHAKQVNIVVILTEIDDPMYRYAIENAWLGGEKNDVVVMIGVDGTTITWVDVMTWALNKDNELFHVTLRDRILALGEYDTNELGRIIPSTINELFDRPQMADFEYLQSAIDPPGWVIILAIMIAIPGSLFLSFVFHRYEVNDYIGALFTGKRNHRNFGSH